MRTADEIQWAHDTFAQLVAGELPVKFEDHEAQRPKIQASLDALCWVLEHDDNQAFGNNLSAIHDGLTEAGYVLRKAPAPFVGRPPPDDVSPVVAPPATIAGNYLTAEYLAEILQDLLVEVMDAYNASRPCDPLRKLLWARLDDVSRQLYIRRAERLLELYEIRRKDRTNGQS